MTAMLKKQQGLSLIELMVAIVIGLFLVGGLIQLFTSSKENYRVQDNLSRVQENGRFAMHFLTQDIRMADYWGCLPTERKANQYADLSSNLNPDNGGVTIYDDFTVPLDGTNADVNDAADTITVRGVANNAVSLAADMLSKTADLVVLNNGLFTDKSLAMVSDCFNGDIFQNVNNSSTELKHQVEPATVQDIGNSDGSFSKAYKQDEAFVYPLKFVTYSVDVGTSGEPSLFRTLNGGDRQELVEGVENLQVLYGEDTDPTPDGIANTYRDADDVVNMGNVVSVRVAIVVRSLEDNLISAPRVYTDPVFDDDLVTADRRIRRVFTSTIGLRNRLD